MTCTKPWYQSKSVLGGVVSAIAEMVAVIGYSVSEADQASLVELLIGASAAVGGIVAIVGRVVATKRIGSQNAESRTQNQPPMGPGAMAVLIAAGLAVAVLLVASGCNGQGPPPSEQTLVARQRQAFTAAMSGINAAIRSGVLEKEDARKLAPLVGAVEKGLNEAEAIAKELAALRGKLLTATAEEAVTLQAQIETTKDKWVSALRILNAALAALEDVGEGDAGAGEHRTSNPTPNAEGDIHDAGGTDEAGGAAGRVGGPAARGGAGAGEWADFAPAIAA